MHRLSNGLIKSCFLRCFTQLGFFSCGDIYTDTIETGITLVIL
jgi:hypothetical protein